MNSFVIALVAALAVTDASNLIASPSAKILQGPSSKTTIIGPEGSAISAVAPGGQIIHEEQPGVVAYGGHGAHFGAAAYSAPLVSSHSVAAPLGGYAGYSHHGSFSGYSSHLAHSAPVIAHHSAPLAYSGLASGHFGAGTHFGRYAGASHPVVSSHSSHIVHSSPLAAHSAPIVAAHSAPLAYSAHSAPVVASHSSHIVHSSPYAAGGHFGYAAHSPVVAAHSAPLVSSYSAPSAVVAHHHGLAPAAADAVVAGPSGTIVSGKSFGYAGHSGWGQGYSGLAHQRISAW